ncbi:hypothetical protein P171DRAFT_448311 [Karstenula rhodostoma CBS 690.94]|uniref:Uncharacterized protein n=1 Tax=Karstenula rhodostoma CBS 690.94 TaxID=1392251 RepID=A0A9P4U7T9_9PLEO|nr:hypothetical protein P171DRAFT_448311 [Karstenula rhodostoma CBS 690.94]
MDRSDVENMEPLSASAASSDASEALAPPLASNMPIGPQLPAELWGQVLSNIGNYTLWIVCRNVNKTLKSEVEREFRVRRLHKLRFRWMFQLELDHSLNTFDFSRTDQIETRGWVDHFSGVDDSHVHYRYDMHSYYLNYYIQDMDTRGPRGDHARRCVQSVRNAITAALQFRASWQARASTGGDDHFLRRSVAIGTSLQDIALPSFVIDFDSQTFSFDWRPFVTEFYSFETAFRTEQQKHPQLIAKTTPDESEWFEKALESVSSITPMLLTTMRQFHGDRFMLWFSNNGRENAYLWYRVCHRYYTQHHGRFGLDSHVKLKTYDEFRADTQAQMMGKSPGLDWIRLFATVVQRERRLRLAELLSIQQGFQIRSGYFGSFGNMYKRLGGCD